MKHTACLAMLLAHVLAETTRAERGFGLVFQNKYVSSDPADDQQQQWRIAVRKTGCCVCHVQGQPKKYCNAYGDALSSYLDRRDDSPDHVAAAMQRVEAMTDSCGTQFGALFRQYRLPRGELGPKSQAEVAATKRPE
jgi:hypothetical protein